MSKLIKPAPAKHLLSIITGKDKQVRNAPKPYKMKIVLLWEDLLVRVHLDLTWAHEPLWKYIERNRDHLGL
jgi:hypothetical protein